MSVIHDKRYCGEEHILLCIKNTVELIAESVAEYLNGSPIKTAMYVMNILLRRD